MGFKELQNRDQKIYFNLSEHAYRIINEDRFIFLPESSKDEKIPFANFINTIFCNFKSDLKSRPEFSASASVHSFLKKEAENLYHNDEEGIPHFKNIDDIVNGIIKGKYNEHDPAQLILKYKYDEVDKKVKGYPKSVHKQFRVNNENYNYLKNCSEEVYYGNYDIEKYFKAVIEEYADKPFFEREKIYYKKRIDKIEEAIANKAKIWIKVGERRDVVSPYRVQENKEQTYNYLIAIHDDKRTCCYRLSNLEDFDIDYGSHTIINSKTKKIIENDIAKKGVEFLTDDVRFIKVKLSPAGEKYYKSRLHLRPEYIKNINDNVYIFNCTARQAEYYFFNFGEDAIIIEPTELADKMKKRYQNAYNEYDN